MSFRNKQLRNHGKVKVITVQWQKSFFMFFRTAFMHELRTDSNRDFSAANGARPRSFLINCKSLCHYCQCKTIFVKVFTIANVNCQV